MVLLAILHRGPVFFHIFAKWTDSIVVSHFDYLHDFSNVGCCIFSTSDAVVCCWMQDMVSNSNRCPLVKVHKQKFEYTRQTAIQFHEIWMYHLLVIMSFPYGSHAIYEESLWVLYAKVVTMDIKLLLVHQDFGLLT